MAEEENKNQAPPLVAEELQEKKVKKAFLEKFKFVKKPEEGSGKTDNTDNDEAVIDSEEQIYRRLANTKAREYVVWRIKKKWLLVGMGLALLIMWVIILSQTGIEKYFPKYAFWNPELVKQQILAEQPQPSPTPEASPAAKLKIRIRDNSQASASAQMMASYLQELGFIQTEVVDDRQSEYQGISLITKAGDNDTRELLEKVLQERYVLSSPSAELTGDSDFDAVILYAQNETLTNTPTRRPTPTTIVATTSAIVGQ